MSTETTPRIAPAAGSPFRGRFGPCRGTPLDADAIARLSTGDKVEVVWVGGNGPHIYEVREDLGPREIHCVPLAVSADKLLKAARFVALANAERTDRSAGSVT